MDDQEEIIVEEQEEGELSDDSDNAYTPLERPENYSNLKTETRFPQPLVEQDSESEDQQSTDLDSDSDSKGHGKSKKPRIKLKAKPQLPRKTKKYDIWSTRVQEDVLSETLNSCDVTKKDRSRDVESYDYVVSARYQNVINGDGNKRTKDDRNNVHRRLGKRKDFEENEKPLKGKCRNIADLATSLEDSIEDIAKDISNKLFEEKEDLILKVLNILGKQKCFDKFEETRVIEKNGGMLIMNQTRRRTPGGVFLHLLRCDESITQDQKRKMFNEERSNSRKDIRKKKLQKLKEQTAQERAKILPELISRAKMLMENRLLKDAIEVDVRNPPPTPETDVHENSSDGPDNVTDVGHNVESTEATNKLISYDDDFLDLACSNNDMDLF